MSDTTIPTAFSCGTVPSILRPPRFRTAPRWHDCRVGFDAQLLAALAAQLELRRELLADGARHVGWKLAFGIDALEAVLGTRPGTGYLTSATQLADGALFSAAG